MNIIVKPYESSLCYCRPDTTWERENRDFYSPECVNEIYWTPVVFARISKAGKCIGQKFVERYYDGVGCGILMTLKQEKVPMEFSTCADHSSILPMPLYNPIVLVDGKKVFEINTESTDKKEKYSVILSEGKSLLEEAICKASTLTSLRIGDFVTVELDKMKQLASRSDTQINIRGSFCENETFNFKMIF